MKLATYTFQCTIKTCFPHFIFLIGTGAASSNSGHMVIISVVCVGVLVFVCVFSGKVVLYTSKFKIAQWGKLLC